MVNSATRHWQLLPLGHRVCAQLLPLRRLLMQAETSIFCFPTSLHGVEYQKGLQLNLGHSRLQILKFKLIGNLAESGAHVTN
jgi:hypothetical protein